MNKSIWQPKWWVFLPVALLMAACLWLGLGHWLGLSLMPVSDSVSSPYPNYPAWLIDGYYLVVITLALVLTWALPPTIGVIDFIHGTPVGHSPWALGMGISISVLADCLLLYGMLLVSRWMQRTRQSNSA